MYRKAGEQSSTERFEALLAQMQAEAPEERERRWRERFDQAAGPRGEQLVLFGSGPFGRWLLGRLRQAGVEPCCFSDNNPSRWNTEIDGIAVLPPIEAVERYGQRAAFVVTIYNGSAARQQLRQMGCATVLSAPLLFSKYRAVCMPEHGIDAPGLLVTEAEAIRRCFSILADEASRREFCDQLAWRYWGSPESLPLPRNQGELYFPDELVSDCDEEVLVDCGAFDGDSIRSFMRRGRSFRHIYALEPDTTSAASLRASLSQLPGQVGERVTVWPYAVGDADGTIGFVASSDVTSKVYAAGEGTAVEVRRLDSLPWAEAPTYIKMDVEGSEPLALAGAAGLLSTAMPVLAICLYHRSEHLWQIPNLIHSLAPGYSLSLRRYAEDCWEQVCYAVPPGRLARQPLG